MSAPRPAPTPAPEPLSKQRLRLWLRLLRAQRTVEAQLRDGLRQRFDTTLPRFDVLSALDRNRAGLRMSDLSAKLKVSNGNVTGIVERLVADGLVERTSVDGDRRAMRVRLTRKGLDRFATMAAEHEDWVNAAFENLEGADLDTTIRALTRIGEEQT